MVRFAMFTLICLIVFAGAPVRAAESEPRKHDKPAPKAEDLKQSSEHEWYDVVIYGGTSAAITAAVQVKKMGKSVVIVSPDKHLGGLSSGGLGWTDSGNKAVIGGLSREFYQRVKKYYDEPAAWKFQKPGEYSRYRPDDDAMWVFEPHIAERVFEDFVDDYDIPVVREAYLDRENGVRMSCCRILSIKTLDGQKYAGQMFIDATYEGDLLAAADVSYTTGREPNSKYDETLNGVQKARARSHQFKHKISPYVVPGEPSSGLLPRIHDGDPGEDGSGDHRIQAYNFRMCLTRVPENRVPFPKPEGYDPDQYELLLRSLKAGSRHIKGKFDPAPNAKTDTNNHGSFSTDNIGYNYDYPEASYERRREIIKEHETYQKGYCYFLANDPRVPEDVRQWYSAWGLAKDEFIDNGHWPHQIYVREARRMVGMTVVNENHLRYLTPTEKSVGMGSYNMDSHNTQRYVAYDENGQAYARNEGDIQINPGGPYPIDYGAIVPREGECDNLLVTCAVSASHIAYGSIRMEPVFMILGQSAATAAVHAMEDGIPVQQVSYEKLSKRLIEDGQVLTHESSRRTLRAKKLDGVVVDDREAEYTGKWETSSSIGPFVDLGYRHDDNTARGEKAVTFDADLPKAGKYEVRVYFSPNANRASNAHTSLYSGSTKKAETKIDQRKAGDDGPYVSLGTFDLDKTARVVISNAGADGYVIADAVQL